MLCPNCQQPLREGTVFCTRCGARTSQGPDPQADSVPTAEAARRVGVTELPDEPDSMKGRVLDGKYEIVGRLGEGGMGAVYRARRVHIGDEVAVKVLHAKLVGDETLVERFRREARAAAQLHHPNVVTIHDYGEASGNEGFAYIVMELVAGPSLRELLKREGRLAVGRAVSLMRDICAGVGAAHRRDIVHRDIKPDNIIVLPPDEDHESERIKVVDFGIAKLRDMASDGTLTQAGAVVGTPFYMSPEQCRGEHLDARADVYSLGALLYEMLAGTPPFTAPSVTGVIAKHLTEAPPSLPRELNVPAALEAAITRALSKEPSGRQRDATEFAREVQAAASAAPSADAQSREPYAPLFPTDAPPSQVVPKLPAAQPPAQAQRPPAQSAAPPRQPQPHMQPRSPHAQAQPQHVAPRPRKSRAGLIVGIFIGALVALVAVAGGAFLYFSGRPAPRVAMNVNTRPTPRPTATPAPTRTPSPLPSPTPAANANANTQPQSAASAEAVRREVRAALEGWADSTREGDIDAHMAFYADRLDDYYLRSGVAASQVRADRSRAFDRFDRIDITLRNIEITPDPSGTQATAVFDKSWVFESDEENSIGAVRQQLTLTKVGDRWLIKGEKDLQVLFTNTRKN